MHILKHIEGKEKLGQKEKKLMVRKYKEVQLFSSISSWVI